MQQGFSFKNILQNMTKGQKRALIFGFVMIMILIAVLSFLVSIPQDEILGGDDGGIPISTEGVTTKVYYDEEGHLVAKTTDANGNSIYTTYYFNKDNIETVTTGSNQESASTSYYDEDGNVTIKTTTITSDGKKIVTEIKGDGYGNFTTTDPNLISTYFPYQMMREHEDGDETFRMFLDVNEEEKVIEVTMEGCSEEENKELAQEYIDHVPVDLSAYTVSYELVGEDVICSK